MHIYAVTMAARKPPGSLAKLHAAWTAAPTKAEAIGNGLLAAKALWPYQDGWREHVSVAIIIPLDMMAGVLASHGYTVIGPKQEKEQ